MKENEAIEYLQNRYLVVGSPANPPKEECEKHNEVVEMAINALEEVQKYRAIGTPEECRAATEKQNPIAAIAEKEDTGTTKYTCQACGRYMGWSTGILPACYCWKCGQKLDWSNEE